MDRFETIKKVAFISALILMFFAAVFFLAAILKGCDSADNKVQSQQNSQKIQVYINDNDSIVNQLQSDIIQLNELISEMREDSIMIVIKRYPKRNPRPISSED